MKDQDDTTSKPGITISLTPEEAAVAWRALDMMDSASFSPEDDRIIARVTAHFARQLPPRPSSAPHTHGPAPRDGSTR